MYFLGQVEGIISEMLKNKLRVFLTMLGVIVGVSAVVLIMSVGLTATDVVKMYFAGNLGDNRITTYISSKNGKDFSVSYDEFNKLATKYPIFVGPLYESENILSGNVRVDDSHYSLATMKGVSYAYFSAYQKTLEEGRFLNKSDCENVSSAAVISSVAAQNCFGNSKNAIGKRLEFCTSNGMLVDIVIVGVYKDVDTTGKFEKLNDKRTWSTDVFCTFEYMNELMGIDTKKLKFDEFSIIMDKSTDMNAVIGLCKSMMKKRFDDEDYKFECYRGFSRANETNGIVITLMAVFVAAAVLTLIVGGICLMNTMLVTVKERTKEIGTKKAIGASNLNIVSQFLLESVFICLIACIIGVTLSVVMIFALNKNINNIFELVKDEGLRSFLKTNDIKVKINSIAVFVSVCFSVFVGVVFGVNPSLKAAKMQITEALRYE